MGKAAIFWDRDDTLIADPGYLDDPGKVELLPGAAEAVKRLADAGFESIVVTNQSGIARGLLTENDYLAVRARIDDLFEERGAFIDDHYHCPHHPDFTGPCECRKPGIGMFETAIKEHQVDAALSLFVGDRLRDLLPAKAYGARGILVPSPATDSHDVEEALAQGFEVATSLTEAAAMFLGIPHTPER
jgi:histidinol-phosphate phosphatase family protein